jgi:anaerobic selenocysteine-containing dehydrogenase
MKIDRRSFLSFVIGGAAGTTLSPLPWKLTDDLSIWTQMWPWVPVPRTGEVSEVKSVCTLCPGGCGISVRKVGERAVKIEGMNGHPINDGGICLLGASGLQLLYGPTRVQTPLKRSGKRGEGKWRKISWDEAISEVAEKLGELRTKGQSHAVGCISGAYHGTVPQLLERLLTVYGSPNLLHTPSIQDSYDMTLYLMNGVRASAGFDFENADFILSFGSGVLDGWGSPVRMFRVNSLWQDEDSKVVQIEPRLSNTAANADKWIPIKPGTEAALALGLAHVIIKESLYSDFVKNHAFGFDDYKDNRGSLHKGFKRLVLEAYDPEKVASITGIEKSVIVDLARGFSNASKPLAICGRGEGRTAGDIYQFMAVHALNALVGNINKKGGVWAVPEPDYIHWPEVEMDRTAAAGMQKERLDGAGSKTYPYTRSLLNQFFEAIEAGEKYPLQALFVSDANPRYTLPDLKIVKKAFDKIPFVVSFSSYMDETAENADLILPNHLFLERYEDLPRPVGFQKPLIGLSKPVIEPRFHTKHLGDVIILIAKALGGSIADAFPWDSYEACLEETLGAKWDSMVENGFWTDPAFRAPDWDQAFETASGKFEFFVSALKTSQSKDMDALPHFRSVAIEGDEAAYPLILVPYDSIRLASGEIGNPPFVTKTVADTVLKRKDVFVQINPVTARQNRLAEGKYAILTTPKGEAKVKVHLFDGIMPDLVALPRGLGHTNNDKYLSGKGVNFNELIGPVKDPVSGLDAAWGIRAKLTKA